MNYILIPLFVIFILVFKGYVKQHTTPQRLRENICVMWLLTLLFSLLGGIISFHIYHYELLASMPWGLVSMLLLYLVLALALIALSPSGYCSLFGRKSFSQEELLYAEYRFHNTLEMLRDFFLMLLLVIPLLYWGYRCIEERFSLSYLLEEAYLIGGLYFVTFCILFPISLRQSIYWLRQLQRIPSEQERELLQAEIIRLHYHRKNRRI